MRRTSSASFSFRDSCSANSPSCVSRYLTSSFKPSRVWAACSSINLLNFSSRRLKKRNIKDLNLSDSCGHKSYHHCHREYILLQADMVQIRKPVFGANISEERCDGV